MKSNELRIGNIVRVLGRKECEGEQIVRGVSELTVAIEAGQIHTVQIEHLFPIAITEEWLVRFGFDRNYGEYTKGCLMLDCEYTDNGVFVTCVHEKCVPVDTKYLHQLQNLYFALTGEELQLK